MTWRKLLYDHRHFVIIFVTPLILIPLPVYVTDEKGTCGYMLILMGVYWCTECLPLGVTGLLPVFLAPLFGILTTVEVCYNYLKDSTMMFTGGLFVAIALEKSNLHRRIAINVLRLVGTEPKWLMFGFMLPTWFLSMWISNTATTAMMLPILEAVLGQLKHTHSRSSHAEGYENTGFANDGKENINSLNKKGAVNDFPVANGGIELSKYQLKDHQTKNDSTITTGNGQAVLIENNISSNEDREDDGEKQLKDEMTTEVKDYEEIEETFYVTISSNEDREDDGEKQLKDEMTTEVKDYEEIEETFYVTISSNEDREDGGEKQLKDEVTVEVEDDEEIEETPEFKHLCRGMTLAVAYAANVGGTATLTGTGPNTILKGHADEIWFEKGLGESPVTYTSWLIYGFPQAVINFVFVYLWLRLLYLGLRSFTCKTTVDEEQDLAVKSLINREHKNLGPVRYNEAAVGILFTTLVMLWFFRSPGFMIGWGDYFKAGYIGDAVPAIFIATLMFCIPNEIPNPNKIEDTGTADALLDWPIVHKKYPWSIIFLMGGGFALAEACEESGLSEWIGEQLAVFGNLPGWLMVAIICLLVAMLTEVTSNSATCTILMPIVASMAETLGMNPLYLMMPTAIATSFAFMLPVATPPNAIAFSYGRISVMDMMKAGAMLNVLCVISVTLATHTWAYEYFEFDTIPWDTSVNVTTENSITSLI